MNILVVGSGGREHAICRALKKSDKVEKLYCLPGNAGIAELAECVPGSVMDFEGILSFLNENKNIDLTFVAPDDPLSAGLCDFLNENGHKTFGPSKLAAEIEGSKSFSKYLMSKYNIPTAGYEEFTDYQKAYEYVKGGSFPTVIKADGLALGKGVIIAKDIAEADTALKDMLLNDKFGKSGKRVIIEEFMVGKEVTVLAFCDGEHIVPMISSQDHKRAYDNDLGLNTGGMGTFAPSKAYTKEVEEEFYAKIMYPTVEAMKSEGRPFSGILYFGLMITDKGVKVVEYNARFGDPEAQVVLPLLETDLVDIINAVSDKKLDELDVKFSDKSAVCVMLCSGGYPEEYKKGYPITVGNLDNRIYLYHSGTAKKDGQLVTNGGRVIGVSAVMDDIESARKLAYDNIKNIQFEGMFFRNDIGIKL